jgi:FkbM family methyltransferase
MFSSLKQFLYRYPALGEPVFRAVEWYKQRKPGAQAQRRLFARMTAHGIIVRSILDVGANRGEWSRLAMHSFPSACCLLIEPQTEMIPHLQSFARRFSQAQYKLAGAGAQSGELTLTVWDDRAGSSFVPTDTFEQTKGFERRTVPIITVNSLIAEGLLPVPDLVKIDVQGFELEVLKGMTHCFESMQVCIIEVSLMEFFPSAPLIMDIMSFMAENGYVLYDVVDSMRRPLDDALAQLDCVFVRTDSVLRANKQWA